MTDILKGTSFISTVLAECEGNPQIVLDLNPNWHTIELARKLPQSQVVGLAASPRFSEPAGIRWNRQKEVATDNLSMICGDLEELPFEDGTFDLLLFVLEKQSELPQIECLEPGLKEMGRVLAIEGISVINFPGAGVQERGSRKRQSSDPGTKEIVSILSRSYFLNYLEIVKKELNLGIAFKRIR